MEVYLAHTPYHLFLCILNGCVDRDSVVYLLDETGNLDWYNKADVTSIFGGRFVYLSLQNKSKLFKISNKNSFLSSLVNSPINSILKSIIDINPSRVYVFADYMPEIQVILNGLSGARVTYIEDGSAPYNSHKLDNKKSRWIQKILFGAKYERISTFGTSRFIQDSLFTYPELVRVENKTKTYGKIEIKEHPALRALANLYQVDEKILKEQGETSIYLYPPYEDKWLSGLFESYIARDITNNIIPIIKRHPKSNESAHEDVWEIDRHIPTELILFLLPNLKTMFSYPSTSLFTATLVTGLEVNCIVPNKKAMDIFFIENLRSIGVNIIFDD